MGPSSWPRVWKTRSRLAKPHSPGAPRAARKRPLAVGGKNRNAGGSFWESTRLRPWGDLFRRAEPRAAHRGHLLTRKEEERGPAVGTRWFGRRNSPPTASGEYSPSQKDRPAVFRFFSQPTARVSTCSSGAPGLCGWRGGPRLPDRGHEGGPIASSAACAVWRREQRRAAPGSFRHPERQSSGSWRCRRGARPSGPCSAWAEEIRPCIPASRPRPLMTRISLRSGDEGRFRPSPAPFFREGARKCFRAHDHVHGRRSRRSRRLERPDCHAFPPCVTRFTPNFRAAASQVRLPRRLPVAG